MYSGDHIILSASYGVYASRALGLPLIPTTAIAIATNLIDLDHQVFYYLDDGKANSLTIHPIHVYAGCFIFFLHWFWLLSKRVSQFHTLANYGLIILGSFSLHLTADAVAWWLSYSIPVLLGFSGINTLFFIWVCQRFLVPCYEKIACYKFIAFLIGWLVLCHLQLALFEYGLDIRAPESRWAFFFNPLMTGLAAGSLILFHRTSFAKR